MRNGNDYPQRHKARKRKSAHSFSRNTRCGTQTNIPYVIGISAQAEKIAAQAKQIEDLKIYYRIYLLEISCWWQEPHLHHLTSLMLRPRWYLPSSHNKLEINITLPCSDQSILVNFSVQCCQKFAIATKNIIQMNNNFIWFFLFFHRWHLQVIHVELDTLFTIYFIILLNIDLHPWCIIIIHSNLYLLSEFLLVYHRRVLLWWLTRCKYFW